MRAYVLKHLSDAVLLRDLVTLVAQERTATAAVLAHIAEVDERRLYLPAGFPSMFAYCVGVLLFSEESAYKRIRAARAAREFPALFTAVAEGRLHLTGVVLLAPALTPDTADELVAAATHKTRSEIEQLLAQRFPRPDLLTQVRALPNPAPSVPPATSPPATELDLDPVEPELDPDPVAARAREVGSVPLPRVTPLAPQRFALQVTLGQSAHDKLRYAQELLSHQVSSGDIPEVLELALDALIHRLEKRKFAATTRPQKGRSGETSAPRHIPARVKRAVWERDGGRCTFVGDSGQRCTARKFLEFDHVQEVARGGRASVTGMRLRCRAHNQYGAECTFGAGFMQKKREDARRAAAMRSRVAERTTARSGGSGPERPSPGREPSRA